MILNYQDSTYVKGRKIRTTISDYTVFTNLGGNYGTVKLAIFTNSAV